MTLKELSEKINKKLEELPEDTLVLRGDNSGGFEAIHELSITEAIELNNSDKEIQALVIE